MFCGNRLSGAEMFIFEQIHRQRSINARCVICRGCPVNLILGITHMDTHLTSNGLIYQQQALVSIYWDYQNIPTLKLAQDLLLLASEFGYVVNRKVYDNWQQRNKAAQVTLRSLNFECFHVSQNIKNAVDFHLSADCFSEASSSLYPHTFIIVSGDGYGEILIQKLQDKGKKVIIVARKGNDSHNLKKLADRFYLVDELPKSIETYKLTA